jgi:NAD(P)H dehydrogenase (quinone)
MKSSAINVTVEDAVKFDISLLPNYDSIVLGSPTYFSNVAWQVKKVIDESIVHYSGGKLKGKVAGTFTSAGTRRDGTECLKMLEVALGRHHGMKVIEPGVTAIQVPDAAAIERSFKMGRTVAQGITA